jgi:hypothetical protein
VSRGPGRWQRLILAAVAEHGEVIVKAIVQEELGTGSPPRAAMVAATRAARVLADAGKLTLGEAYTCPLERHPQPFIRFADRCDCCRAPFHYAPRYTLSVARAHQAASNTYPKWRRSETRRTGPTDPGATLSAEALAEIRAGEERYGGATLQQRSEQVAEFTAALGGTP